MIRPGEDIVKGLETGNWSEEYFRPFRQRILDAKPSAELIAEAAEIAKRGQPCRDLL